MNTREDSCPDYGDEHGPQKRPASVSQIEAGQKQVEADSADAKACLRLFDAAAFVADDAAAMSYQTMGQYRTALLKILSGDGPEKQSEAAAIKARANPLPDAFVCFIPGKTRARRYVRSCVKSWDVHIWSGQWEFYDIIGNRTAVEDFDKALHAVALKDLR